MMVQITIHDEQGRLRGVEAYVRKCCTAIASNFRNTEVELYGLLADFEDKPVFITAHADGQRKRVDVYINANNRKTLAEAVVYEVGHYFGEPENKPKNTKDAAIIENKMEAWLQVIPDTYITKPELYPDRVFDRAMLELHGTRYFGTIPNPTRYEFPPEGIILDGCEITDSELAGIIEAVGRWVKKQDQQQAPTAQQLPVELTTDKSIKYLERAAEKGYWERTGDTATWKKTPAMLGYFCLKAFDQPRPITQLELYFGVKNLAASISQASYPAKRADVKKWRGEMDNLVFFD